jgi:acylphosphatase
LHVIHIEVAGRVQGIGFRHFVRERARALDLSGWVRNLASGNLEIAAGGTESSVTQMLEDVRIGPPGAEVKQVFRLSSQSVTDLPKPFTILK